MNERITISDAILIDAISELTDHAKSIFGDKYKYETTVLGNKIGVTDITLPQPTNGAVNLGGATARKQANDVRPNVPINTFDALWKEKYMGFEPNLIKIDAEGLDIDVIEGMREFLTSLDTKPLIVYEIAGINMSEDEVDEVYDRLSFLTEMGYEPIWEDSLAPKKCCDLVIGIKDEIETII
jgi:FkbM family methyltransferase